MLMPDIEIQKAIVSKELVMNNFSQECLQPASYDMRVGEEAFSSHEKKPINIKSTGFLNINPGDFILVGTYESVKLSSEIAGRIGLRSFHARKGLALLAGPQIDPGFDGILVVGLHNLDANELKLSYKERFCTVEFYRLSEPVENPYKGEYHHQNKIMKEDCQAIKERIPAWAPIDVRLKTLEEKVKKLKEQPLASKAKFAIAEEQSVQPKMIPRDQAREGVIDLFTQKKELDYVQIMSELGLDLKTTIEICTELEKEGKIKAISA